MRDEDDNWFDALAGHAEGPDSAARAGEGATLRAAILARNAAEQIPVAAEDPTREAELINRARTAGLLPPASAAALRRAGDRAGWHAGWPVWLAAAAMAFVVIGVTLQMRAPPPIPVMRGGVAGIVQISSQDPVRLKQDLIRELGAAGVRASGYESLGRQGIDADLPTPVPAAVLEVLQRHGIAPPTDNILRVEIELAPPP